MKKVLKIIFWIFLITIMVCSLWSLSFAWFASENQLNDDTTENLTQIIQLLIQQICNFIFWFFSKFCIMKKIIFYDSTFSRRIYWQGSGLHQTYQSNRWRTGIQCDDGVLYRGRPANAGRFYYRLAKYGTQW